jgi:ABC-2 type transport system permease protein
MFSHIYIYRMKCLIRDKQLIFWTLLFPILLAILFEMALSNITQGEVFKEIKIAVVDNAEFQKNTDFKQVLESLSSDEDGGPLFNITYTTKEECVNLLKDNEIEGYIFCDNDIQLEVKNNGLNQTVIKSFLDDYKQTVATVNTIIAKNPQSLQKGLINDISSRKDYLKDIAVSDAAPDTAVHYFYTLIAMACLYGSFWGLKEVTAIQANQSAQGARISTAPTHKVKVFTVSILAAVTVQIIISLLLLLFLIFVLGVDFGNKLGYIVLTCIVGSFTGVSFGTFVSITVKKGEGVKAGILTGGSMLMSFLAGMMYDGMKLLISNNVPILGYLNPANLIADSFYALYFYTETTHYFINILILAAMTVVFGLFTYIVLRRQKYASI